MKLVIEIEDRGPKVRYNSDGSKEKAYWNISSIVADEYPCIRGERCDALDNKDFSQAERLARLIALSKEIDRTVEEFYSKKPFRFKIAENSE